MRLSELIKRSLDGKKILGKDRKEYIVQVTNGGHFSICIRDVENPLRYGVFPEIRDLGTMLYNYEMADFTYASRQGLYKKIIHMISEIVPVGTSYKGSIANHEDKQEILKYVKDNEDLSVKESLEKTCFGHVLLSSKFNDVELFYKGLTETVEGVDALLNFSGDTEKKIFPNSYETDLYLIGIKTSA